MHGSVLIRRVIHAECLGGNDAGRSLPNQLLHRAFYCGRNVLCRAGIHIDVFAGQELACRQLNATHRRVGSAFRALQAAPHCHDTHVCNVAFQQSVGSLCGTVGNEGNILRADAVFLHHLMQHLHDARGHALFGRVGGRHLHGADEFICIVVDRDSVGKGTADIDANAHFHIMHSPVRCSTGPFTASPRAKASALLPLGRL